MFHGGQDLLYRASDAGSGPLLPHGLFKAHRSVYDGIYADKSHLFKLPAHRYRPAYGDDGDAFPCGMPQDSCGCLSRCCLGVYPSLARDDEVCSFEKRVECNGVEHHFNPCRSLSAFVRCCREISLPMRRACPCLHRWWRCRLFRPGICGIPCSARQKSSRRFRT